MRRLEYTYAISPAGKPSKGFPSPVIDVCLQLATDRGRNVVIQPHITEEAIVSFLIQNQLPISSEPGINLAMAVKVWSKVPGAVLVMEVEDRAFAYVDEEAHVFATSSGVRSQHFSKEGHEGDI